MVCLILSPFMVEFFLHVSPVQTTVPDDPSQNGPIGSRSSSAFLNDPIRLIVRCFLAVGFGSPNMTSRSRDGWLGLRGGEGSHIRRPRFSTALSCSCELSSFRTLRRKFVRRETYYGSGSGFCPDSISRGLVCHVMCIGNVLTLKGAAW
jgi:hypothetical protein